MSRHERAMGAGMSNPQMRRQWNRVGPIQLRGLHRAAEGLYQTDEMRREKAEVKVNRREMIKWGAVGTGAAVAAGAGYALWPAPAFDFTAVARPAGFRRIARGDGLSAGALLSGFETTGARAAPLSDARICDLAFGGHSTGQGRLAVAVFSDFFCPYCRVLDLQVRELAAKDDRITVVPHEVPLLGVPSQFAARAVLAAAAQGAYDAFHARLIRTTFVPNPAYLRAIAAEEGLDVAQFETDMRADATTARIDEGIALFRAFGFVGTPGLAVGSTLVNGAIAPRALRALMRLEIDADAPGACA